MRDTCNRDRNKDKINKIKLKKTSFFWAVKNLRTLSLWITHVDVHSRPGSLMRPAGLKQLMELSYPVVTIIVAE